MAAFFYFVSLWFLVSQSLAFGRELVSDVYFTNETALAGGSFTNPLRPKDGSDPFIVYSGGFYYFMSTTWKDVQLTRARTIAGLKNGETKIVYKDGTKNRCCNVWAPGMNSTPSTWINKLMRSRNPRH